MKRETVIGTLAILIALSSCRTEVNEYVIQGKIEDTNEGYVYLKRVDDKSFTIVDSARIENGNFVFQGSLNSPQAFGLTTSSTDNSPQLFFLENAPMEILLNESEKKLQVQGSESDIFFRQALQWSKQDGFQIDTLVAHHPTSPVPAYLLMKSYSWGYDVDGLKNLRSQIDASLSDSYYILQLNDLIKRKESVQVGKIAPDFTLPDPQGNPVSLSSFRGQYVLVDFWASWCPDCRREVPDVKAAYEQLKDRNFTILGVSLDRNREAWVNGIEKLELTWDHVSDLQYWQSDIVNLYAIRWIPSYILVDPEGKIVFTALDSDSFKQGMAAAFGE